MIGVSVNFILRVKWAKGGILGRTRTIKTQSAHFNDVLVNLWQGEWGYWS